ncbi:kynurenine formamidase-like [Styela clava]
MKIAPCLLLCFGFATVCNGKCWKRNNWGRFKFDSANAIDLTHEVNEDAAVWPTDLSLGYKLIQHVKGIVSNGPFKFFLDSNSFSANTLTGTHVDAPSHFNAERNQAQDIHLKEMIGPGVLIDMTKDGVPMPRESLITKEDIRAWERKNGRIREDTIVLFRTGYGDLYWNDRDGYYGTKVRGPAAALDLHVPGLHFEAAKWLIKKRCIAAVGIDIFTIDRGQDLNFPTHRVFADANIAVYEDLANLDQLVEHQKKFFVFAMPLKLKGAAGSPIRIVAYPQ